MTDANLAPTPFRRHRRYQSMAAQQFSASLDSVFRIDDGLDSLVSTVEDKRRSLFTQERELEELQERIRLAEERLNMAAPVISAQVEASTNTEPLPNWSFKPTTASYNKRHTLTLFATMPSPILEEPESPSPVYVQPQPTQQTLPVISGDYAVMSRPRARRRRARLEDHFYFEEEDVEEPMHNAEQRLSQVSTSSESNESCSDTAGDF